MTSPKDVVAFHAEYDVQIGERVRLFRTVAEVVGTDAKVLYAGSYVDISPSVWFDDVTYLDMDKRAPRFFSETEAVAALVGSKREALGLPERAQAIAFHHADYTSPLPEPLESFDVLMSLYAGFISEHCTKHLRIGGVLLVNPSHGDAAMASIDPRYELSGVITRGNGDYCASTDDLGSHLVPKKAQEVTIASLHENGRGIAYTKAAFAYLFTRVA